MNQILLSSVKTLAGNGRCSSTDGPVGHSSLAFPRAIVYDEKTETILIADNFPTGVRAANESQVQTIPFMQKPRLDIKISCMKFNPKQPQIIVFCDPMHNKIRRFNTDTREVNVLTGQVSGYQDGFLTEALFKRPSCVSFACEGRVLLIGDGNGCIRCADLESGQVSTLCGNLNYKQIETDKVYSLDKIGFKQISHIQVSKKQQGILYVSDAGQHCVIQVDTIKETAEVILGVPGRAGRSILQGTYQLNTPGSICELEDGTLIICDTMNHSLKHFDPISKQCVNLSRSVKGWVDGTIQDACFNEPTDIIYSQGKLFIADRGNHVIRIVTIKSQEEFEHVALVKSIRLDETIDDYKSQFKFYCRNCQIQCGLGNDRTCDRCGSFDIIIVDDGENSYKQEQLASQILYQKTGNIKVEPSRSTDSPSLRSSVVQNVNATKSPMNKSMQQSLNLDSLQTLTAKVQDRQKKIQAQRQNDVSLPEKQSVNFAQIKLKNNIEAKNIQSNQQESQQQIESEYEQILSVPSVDNQKKASLLLTSEPPPIRQLQNYGPISDPLIKDEPIIKNNQPATVEMFNKQFPDSFVLNQQTFELLCADFNTTELASDLQACPESNVKVALITNKTASSNYQQQLEQFDPILFVRGVEKSGRFEYPLPVNKVGIQFTQFAEPEETIIQLQINSDYELVEVFATIDRANCIEYFKELNFGQEFIRSIKKTKCVQAGLSQLLKFAEVEHPGIYTIRIVAQFTNGKRAEFKVRFGCGAVKGANAGEFDVIQIVFEE
ncbi:NHL_repeat-containing protein [Hexamita inflata]|uniref:NHL repeat-containing protein n=1 Tax=Hexamita inflata TaxID=28002 RepID=A0AA86UKI1_9EUKA|nr:NHL repeat-containing protein [Hexamita inflata]